MIDTQAIRKKILDLALRGKLTEQLPEDGTAEELYQQIQQEKIELEKARKIKKDKDFPLIAEKEKPFDIPNGWKWVRLDSIASIISKGTTPRGGKVSYSENGVGFLRAENLKGFDKLNLSNLNYIDESVHVGFLKRSILEDGDILISIAGTLGRTGLVRKTDLPLNANQAIAFIRPVNKYRLNLCYIIYALNAKTIQKMMDYKKVEMAIPNLSLTVISNTIIPLPPLAEQKRIVDKIESAFSILNTVDALQNQYQDNLATLKSKIIDAGIQGKLTEQLPEDGTAEELYQQIHTNQGIEKKDIADINADLPEIPFTWCWVHLGDIVRVLGGKRIPAGRKLTTEDTGHKYIRISDMKNRSVDAEKLLFVPEDIYPSIAQYIIHKEDVYITVAGTIGRVGKIPESVDGANLTENADRLVFSNLDQNWLIYCLTSTFVQKQIEYLTTQVAQPKLAIKRIQEFLLPLPPLAEQKRIVAKLEELLPLCEG